jgi:hypothetical protein
MVNMRRRHDAAFKAKVALELIAIPEGLRRLEQPENKEVPDFHPLISLANLYDCQHRLTFSRLDFSS